METDRKIVDPEPWVHRWPNNAAEGARSAHEKCTVSQCSATHEPRSQVQLDKAYNRKPHWLPRSWRKVKAAIEWLRQGA